MSDYGFSLILGRPFSDGFQQWFVEHVVERGGRWNQAQFLHATLVNCTRPNARSQENNSLVVSQIDVLRKLWIKQLIPILQAATEFELVFDNIEVVNGTAVLPTRSSFAIAELLRDLQGGLDWIGEDDAPVRLQDGGAIGINKFATLNRRRAETVSITLGQTLASWGRMPNEPPPERISGIRIAYYRDRFMVDCVCSSELQFGKNSQDLQTLITEFCHSI